MIVHLINTLASGGAEKLMLQEVQSSKTEKHVIVVLRDVSTELSELVNLDEILIERLSIRTLIHYSRMRKEVVIKSHLFWSHVFTIFFWILGCKILWVYHSTIYSGKLSHVQRVARFLSYFVPDRQVYVSEHAKNTHLMHGFSNRNITVLHNGIRLSSLTNVIYTGNNRVAFLGRNTKVKNIDLLLATIRSCKRMKYDLEFYLFGEDFQESNREIVALLDNYDVYDSINLMGYRENVFDSTEHFGLVVSTSIDESFGLALVEAAARGIPIAAVNLHVMEELFPNFGVNSYSNKPEQNSRHWLKMLNKDLSYKKVLQQKAFNYDIKLMYQRYDRIYKEMVNG